MSDVYNRNPENDLTYNSGTGSYVLTSSLLNPDPIDESTTVKELAVNSAVYDIVGKGILDQNSKTTRLEWFGTKAEYDALGVYADHCTYIITDDSADSRVDEVGAIAEEVNTLKSYDYVVDWQIPTSANGYMWYRKYKSGWVEQGGYVQTPTNTGQAVKLPITMLDVYYQVMVTASCGATRPGGISSVVNRRQGGGWAYSPSVVYVISMSGENASTTPVYWQVSGMSA